MKCPFCQADNQKSQVYPGSASSTLVNFTRYYDEDGLYHSHDPNTTTRDYSCSNGHKWREKTKHKCPSCDYGKDSVTITNLQ